MYVATSLSLAAERTFAADDKNSVEVFEKNYERLERFLLKTIGNIV